MTYVGDGERDAVLARAADARVVASGALMATVVADMSLTGGMYTLYQLSLGPKAPGAAPHFHRTFAETFHVLEGLVELYDGINWHQAGPGDHLFIPQGSIHGFRNPTDEPVEMFMMSVPGIPREDYFEDLFEIRSRAEPPTPEEMRELHARHDQFMV